MSFKESMGGNFLGKIRKAGAEKIAPFLVAAGLSTSACDRNQDDFSSSIPQVEQDLKVQKKEEEPKSQNAQDVLLDELLSNVSEQSEDFQKNTIESYGQILKAVGSKMYTDRMSANKAGEIRYFKKIYGDIEYRKKIRNLIEKYSKEYDIPESIIVAQAALESNFDQDKSVKSTGALGVMQIKADTARDNGLVVDKKNDERKDVEKNIKTGIKILKRYTGNFEDRFLALAAYAHGPTNLRKKLNSLFPQLTLSADKTVFDEAGKEKYFEMLNNGDLNIANLYMLDPVFFKYSMEVAAIGELSSLYLYDDVNHYPKVFPGEGYRTAVAKNK